ncbi:MAG: hypothetical protein ABI630_01465 [Betaproteobacteria bacterium]
MRRSDYDVTDSIRTTGSVDVGVVVGEIFTRLYPSASATPLARAFGDIDALYCGADEDHHPCDTEYHDIQHVLDVTLAMARLMDGYERYRNGYAPLSPEHFQIGVVSALFHDVGYLRRKGDRTHKYGSEYTLTHVSRGSAFLRGYFKTLGLGKHAAVASMLVHFTGYERNTDTIRIGDPLLRKLGEFLGTADIIAQMSDRCYLEKCRDRLYPEFVLGGLARRRMSDGSIKVLFSSGDDLVSKTPGFYANALKRLDHQLNAAYTYAEKHFGGQNLYLEEMRKNVDYAKAVSSGPAKGMLRRTPPYTLRAGVEPYPRDLKLD